MKKGLKLVIVTSMVLCLLQSCSLFNKKCKEADLIIEGVSFDNTTKTLRFSVKNIGEATAKKFSVYAEGEGSTSNQNPVCQISHSINEIPADGSIQLESIFSDNQCPTARGGFNTVIRFKITADSKVQIIECSEDNNSLTVSR